jgi:short-subunit dehydrogenase
MTRIAVVTGASSGIGLATATLLTSQGYRVIGTSRDPSRLTASNRAADVEYRALDLTDRASIDAFAAGLGPVNVLVNNAGESQSGPLEELPADALSRLFQLNVLGQIELTQAVLPGMRERGYGRIVMVGSMLGSFPLAFRSSYSASKAAIRTFADAARLETAPYGVWFSTVEPGSIRTGIGERRTKYLNTDSVYTERFGTVIGTLDRKERNGLTADKVAATILRAVTAEKPKPLYAIGSRAPIVFAMRRALPAVIVERFVARTFGLRG